MQNVARIEVGSLQWHIDVHDSNDRKIKRETQTGYCEGKQVILEIQGNLL